MNLSHLKALIIKNLLIIIREYVLTIIEILSPIIIMLLFFILNGLFKTEIIKNKETDEEFFISNSSIISEIDTEYNSYIPNYGILTKCNNKIVGLIGENFPLNLSNKIKEHSKESYNITFKYYKTKNM